MGICLLQPGQLRNQPLKSMFSKSIHLLNFVTLTNPAHLSGQPSGQIYHDKTNPALYRDNEKTHANPDPPHGGTATN